MKNLRKQDYKILEEKSLLKSRSFEILDTKLALPDKKVVEWSSIKMGDVVSGIVLTEKNTVILVRQFRLAAKDIMLEIPAGRTEAKTEKQRIKELNRELQEEIGVKGKRIEKLLEAYRGAYSAGLFTSTL